MDMREMVDKIKQGKPLWGVSELNEHQQGVAHRNSRYTGVFLHVLPMFNFVNHPYVSCIYAIWRPPNADYKQHGIDTAKYFQQAERELEAERLAKGVEWKDG